MSTIDHFRVPRRVRLNGGGDGVVRSSVSLSLFFNPKRTNSHASPGLPPPPPWLPASPGGNAKMSVVFDMIRKESAGSRKDEEEEDGDDDDLEDDDDDYQDERERIETLWERTEEEEEFAKEDDVRFLPPDALTHRPFLAPRSLPSNSSHFPVKRASSPMYGSFRIAPRLMLVGGLVAGAIRECVRGGAGGAARRQRLGAGSLPASDRAAASVQPSA